LKTSTILAATAIALAFAAPAHAASYTVTPYATPGSTFTQLWGVNDHGVLAGGDDGGGFIDDHGTITSVNLPGSPGFVTGVSNAGTAVGSDGTSSFLYQGGVVTPFAVPGSDSTLVRGISANGRYVAGVFTTSAGAFDGFVWDSTTSTFSTIEGPGGLPVAVVQGVNDNGVAVGSLSGGNGSFLFDAAHGTTGYFTEAYGLTFLHLRAIDDAGDLGGWGLDAQGTLVGFLGTLDTGFTTFDLGATSTLIYGLNNAGEAVGYYDDANGGLHSFVVTTTAVPEPASTPLMLMGLGAVGLAVRRRKATAAAA